MALLSVGLLQVYLLAYLCPVCDAFPTSTAEKQQGKPECHPWLCSEERRKEKKPKPWPHPKTQVGGLAVLAVVPQSLNLIPANLDIVIHLELTVWLTSKPKQQCSTSALLSLAFISAYPRSLFSASHHAFILSPNIPVVSPPTAHCVSVLCSLWQGEYRQGII